MTRKEQQRAMMFIQLQQRRITIAEAVPLLGLSERHVKRLLAAYRIRGPAALVHGNRGRRPRHALSDALKARVRTLAQRRYAGLNHSHLTELLSEREHLTLSRPSIRRILVAAGLPSPRTRRPPRHRRRRERMPQPGMLTLLDGSTHPWLEGRTARLTLLAAMDDATGEVLSAQFRQQEDAHGYLHVLRSLALTHGLPLAVYSDRHSIFHRDKRTAPTLAEQLAGGPAPTQVGRVLRDLGIRWIPASSPQAKGRIERLFGTFQDRLCAELRLARITDLAAANRFLHAFLPRFNKRFRVAPADPHRAYRPWPRALAPDTVFCFKYHRRVANDNTLTLGTLHVQLLPGPLHRSYAKAIVEVHERLNGTVAVFYHGQRLRSRRLDTPDLTRIPARHGRRLASTNGHPRVQRQIPPRPQETPPKASSGPVPPAPGSHATPPRKPAAHHPWRQTLLLSRRRKELREAGMTFSRTH